PRCGLRRRGGRPGGGAGAREDDRRRSLVRRLRIRPAGGAAARGDEGAAARARTRGARARGETSHARGARSQRAGGRGLAAARLPGRQVLPGNDGRGARRAARLCRAGAVQRRRLRPDRRPRRGRASGGEVPATDRPLRVYGGAPARERVDARRGRALQPRPEGAPAPRTRALAGARRDRAHARDRGRSGRALRALGPWRRGGRVRLRAGAPRPAASRRHRRARRQPDGRAAPGRRGPGSDPRGRAHRRRARRPARPGRARRAGRGSARGSVGAVITLYDAERCPYCARVRIVLAEKGIEHEVVAIDLSDRPAWLYEKNPLGKVPVIEEDAFVLPESAVIMEYLDERYPEPALLPADPAARALARLRVWRFD